MQKDGTLQVETHAPQVLEDVQYATGEEWRIPNKSLRNNEAMFI